MMQAKFFPNISSSKSRRKKWEAVTIVKVKDNTVDILNSSGKKRTVQASSLQIRKAIKRKDVFGKPSDDKLTTVRLGRRRTIEVLPVHYRPGRWWGDYSFMMKNPAITKNGIMIFNDNHDQHNIAVSNPDVQQPAGGNNAIVRPLECKGDSIGIPTGPYSSLWDMNYYTPAGRDEYVFRIIDYAIIRIVKGCLKNPDKHVLYYSAAEGSTDIGLGIFKHLVGDDVITRISLMLKLIPHIFQKARQTGGRLDLDVVDDIKDRYAPHWETTHPTTELIKERNATYPMTEEEMDEADKEMAELDKEMAEMDHGEYDSSSIPLPRSSAQEASVQALVAVDDVCV